MKKVLIVDDSLKTRRMLRRHLTKAGYEVVEAENGETALEEIKTNLPDVVLLDLMMPGMSGFEVCQRLLKTPRTDPSRSCCLRWLLIITRITICFESTW